MFKLLALFYVCLMVKTVFTAVAFQPPVEKPEEFACEEGCYSAQLNMVLPYNITYSPQDGKSCLGYLCGYDNYTQIFSCGALEVGPGCEIISGDLSNPYPDCCDTFTCETSE